MVLLYVVALSALLLLSSFVHYLGWFRRRDSLAGQLVLITGAAGGIGRQLALEFARQGAALALWDIRATQLREVRDWLVVEHRIGVESIHVAVVDASDPDAVTAGAAALQEKGLVVRVVVSNAAVMRGTPLQEMSDAEVRSDFGVNTLAAVWCARAFLRHMVASAAARDEPARGVLVTIGSVMGELPCARLVEYCASKAALIQLHEALRWELRVHDRTAAIRTLLVQPYAVDTDMLSGAALLGSSQTHRRFAWLRCAPEPLRGP
jgi:all-trans-retinol dehydrogenase (NAD+)